MGSILIDFIAGLPKVQGKDCIYIMVDKLTRYAHFYAIFSKYKTSQVADLFFKEMFRLHGLPKSIVIGSSMCFGKSSLDSQVHN